MLKPRYLSSIMAYISDQGALMTCDGGWYHVEAVAICVCAFGSKRAGGERTLRNVVYGCC